MIRKNEGKVGVGSRKKQQFIRTDLSPEFGRISFRISSENNALKLIFIFILVRGF